jgi:hypothetical protein
MLNELCLVTEVVVYGQLIVQNRPVGATRKQRTAALMRRRFFIATVRRYYFASLRSKRSRFITLTQEFTKSCTKRCCPSDSA